MSALIKTKYSKVLHFIKIIDTVVHKIQIKWHHSYLNVSQFLTFQFTIIIIWFFVLSQAMTSGSKVDLELKTVGELAKHMNTVIFHTKMVDSLDEMLEETTELSIYWLVLIYYIIHCFESYKSNISIASTTNIWLSQSFWKLSYIYEVIQLLKSRENTHWYFTCAFVSVTRKSIRNVHTNIRIFFLQTSSREKT